MTVAGDDVLTIPSRSGVSPIGTVSPNSGSSANTNSTYAPNAYTSGITDQMAATSYTLQDTDYQGVVIFNTSSAVTVTLNSAVKTNFQATALNLGTGAITLITSDGSGINSGGSSLALASGQGAQVFFANSMWLAYAGTTIVQVVPENLNPVAGVYVTGYNATTGIFDVSTPAGLSVTITTAKLTSGGTEGSMTFTGGILTAQVAAT